MLRNLLSERKFTAILINLILLISQIQKLFWRNPLLNSSLPMNIFLFGDLINPRMSGVRRIIPRLNLLNFVLVQQLALVRSHALSGHFDDASTFVALNREPHLID
jgi:hypothetical protein